MKTWHLAGRPLELAVALLLFVASGAGVPAQSTPYPAGRSQSTGTPESSGTPTLEPTGVYLSPEEIAAFAAEFSDSPLIGGQVAPRLSKWVTDDVFLFLQFDNADPVQATTLRYIGIACIRTELHEPDATRSRGRFPWFPHGLGMIAGADVDRGLAKGRHVFGQCVVHPLHDAVGFSDGETAIDGDMQIGVHLVAQPARACRVHLLHALDVQRRMLHLRQDARLHTVEQP